MGTFTVEVEIGDPQGERWEKVEALVDTGASYTLLPRGLLERLGVSARDRARLRVATGQAIEQDLGQTWIRINGKSVITLVVFGEEGTAPLLGAYALEGLLLAPDPVNKRLVHVEGLLMQAANERQKLTVHYNINGETYEANIEPNRTLLEVMRDELRLTGAKEGCGTGDCGACSMIVNGRLVTSCLMLAPQADGGEITTIEGLAQNGTLHPVQQAFIDQGAVQCGFCIPGMILAGKNLLDHNPSPTEGDIRQAIAGNLCRCTGYTKVVQAIASAANAT